MISFRRQMTSHDRIVMVTTSPQFYQHVSWAEIITIDDAQIKEWQGKHQFFWRAKIMAIGLVGQRYPDDDILYLDCDTVLCGSIDELKKWMEEGHGLMDINEGHPSTKKTKTLRMWKMCHGRTYGGITLGMQHNMYCAGVVGIRIRNGRRCYGQHLPFVMGCLMTRLSVWSSNNMLCLLPSLRKRRCWKQRIVLPTIGQPRRSGWLLPWP